MQFLGKSIDTLDENDLISLIGESESQTLEFKRKSEKDKNEFRADLVSFANARGGWIIYGVEEEEGVATEICGLGAGINADAEIRRLEQIAHSGIEPDIPGLSFRSVDLQDENKSKVIVVHIPRSFVAPHRVQGTGKFHIRRSMGKDEMTIDELRRAFNLMEHIRESIKQFRKKRVEALSVDDHEEVPISLKPGPRLVLHVLPLTFTNPTVFVDLSVFAQPSSDLLDMRFQNVPASLGRFNFDGFVYPDPAGANRVYIQIFRGGAFEIVRPLSTTTPFGGTTHERDIAEKSSFVLDVTTQGCQNDLAEALRIQAKLGVEPPLVVLLSMTCVRGYHLQTTTNIMCLHDPSQDPLKRNQYLLPDVMVEQYESDPHEILRPIFDILWNMGGWVNRP